MRRPPSSTGMLKVFIRVNLPVATALGLGLGLLTRGALAQTDGTARLEVTLGDYNGSGARHYTVVWVTRTSGDFIKTLRKQGPSSWTSKEWRDHCQTWSTARGTSTVLDGYTSATAASYSGTNSPVICSWDARDAADSIMPDGQYKFWVQYAENSGQGPYTTSGLLWTKGPGASTNSFPDQSVNFANMRVTWIPDKPPTIPPTITSAPPAPHGTVGVPYSHVGAATGTEPITFTAAGLPTGLDCSPGGVISGTPLAAGRFVGSITAASGTPPDATQSFVITVEVVPARLAAGRGADGGFVLSGEGPARGSYRLLSSMDVTSAPADWPVAVTGTFDEQGRLVLTNLFAPDLLGVFYLLRVP